MGSSTFKSTLNAFLDQYDKLNNDAILEKFKPKAVLFTNNPNTTINKSTKSRWKLALAFLSAIKQQFSDDIYYICLVAVTITTLAKPFASTYIEVLEELRNDERIPPGFSRRVEPLISKYLDELNNPKRCRSPLQVEEEDATEVTPKRVRLDKSVDVSSAGTVVQPGADASRRSTSRHTLSQPTHTISRHNSSTFRSSTSTPGDTDTEIDRGGTDQRHNSQPDTAVANDSNSHSYSDADRNGDSNAKNVTTLRLPVSRVPAPQEEHRPVQEGASTSFSQETHSSQENRPVQNDASTSLPQETHSSQENRPVQNDASTSLPQETYFPPYTAHSIRKDTLYHFLAYYDGPVNICMPLYGHAQHPQVTIDISWDVAMSLLA